MRTVDVGVGHDYNSMITQLAQVEFFLADTGAHRSDQGTNLVGGYHLVEACLLNVEDFALKWKNRLVTAFTALFAAGVAGAATPGEAVKTSNSRVLEIYAGHDAIDATEGQHAFVEQSVDALRIGQIAGAGDESFAVRGEPLGHGREPRRVDIGRKDAGPALEQSLDDTATNRPGGSLR